MRLLARLDETKLLERIPDGIIGSEGAHPCLELPQGFELSATEIERIRHLFSEAPEPPRVTCR